MMKSRFFAMLLLAFMAANAGAQVTPFSQMEKLNRGVVVLHTSIVNNFISWRLLGTDNKEATTFDVLRDGETIASDLTKTNYQDATGSATSSYQICTKVNGVVTEVSEAVAPWDKKFLTLQLQRPAGGIHKSWNGAANVPYSYYPNDMSVGDVDGDGRYELFLKWESTHAQDNSYSKGYTGNTYIDCYRIAPEEPSNCQLLWRVDLGQNIRDGAHYTQFMVYDFDGDGRAEMICKTATGSKDGQGDYVNQAATDAAIAQHPNNKDYRNSGGHILTGPEYLTVFDGATGKALHTTWYLPGRAGTGKYLPSGKEVAVGEGGSELGKVNSYPNGFWGDNYGGRSERFLGAVAYIHGADRPACAVFCRGYYTKAYVWAVSFDGRRLHTEWLHASTSATASQVYTAHFDSLATYPKLTIDGDVIMRMPVKTAPANTGGVTAADATEGGITGSNTLYANGNHNLSVADVDGDGCDELLWGAAALNNDGTLLYATGYGHGDAMHVGKMIPDSADLYVFDVHEEKLNAKHGSWDLHNARTGRVIRHGGSAGADNGRGMAAALSTAMYGYQYWSSDERNPHMAFNGALAINKSCSVNFRIYWDGSYQDQLFDGSYQYDRGNDNGLWEQTAYADPYIQKWDGSSFVNVVKFNSATYNNAQTCNYTKATPCLQADILGDWREELVMWNKSDSSQVMIFSTWTPTSYSVPTLMHDHVYRMGIAWQNTAYNQPPHLGYYLPDYIKGKLPSAIQSVERDADSEAPQYFDLQGRPRRNLKQGLNIVKRGNRAEKVFVK